MQDGGQAIGAATQNLGQAISGVADLGFKYAERLTKAKDAKGTSAFLTNLDAKATDVENSLIKRQDYSNWNQEWKANVDSWGGEIDALDISENAKADLKLKYAEWAGAKSNRLSTTAALKDVETTKGTIATNLDYYARRGDQIGYQREIGSMRESGIFREDQIKQAQLAGDRIMFETQLGDMVKANPDEAEKFVTSDAFMANEGATTDLRDATLNRIREQKRVKSSDSIDIYRDEVASGIYASVTDVENRWKGKARPSVLEEMKDDYRRRTDVVAKARLSSPEYQAETAGEVAGYLDGMAASDDYEDRYARASFGIDQLADSPLKRRYQEELTAAKQGRTATIKNAQDAAFAGLKQLKDSGRLGTLPRTSEVMSTDRALNDGFLKDSNKLLSLGFDSDQIKQIQEAEDGNENVTLNSQRQKFRQLWTSRANKDNKVAQPDGLTRATAEAILEGNSQVEYLSPFQIRKNAIAAVNVETRYGNILQEMNTFLISKPNASDKEIEQKMFEISGAEGRQAFQASKMNSFPSRSSRAGDVVTSYGYSTDTTPDSNSSAGIGAWVGSDEQERIKRGEQTENRLREGDLAVSRDVERQFKAAGIRPRDTVTIELDDGTQQTGRWMDRTAESYNGKTLTGRFDIYSPKGPSPLNGKKVTGWMKSQ